MSVEVTSLDSGLRVVTDVMPHLETASLGVWVDQGARCETPSEHGISHFLEHMAFKGTRRRDARQIAEEIESVGGDLNAATSMEQTAYYARVLKGDVRLAVDILGDILSNSTFDAEELAREQEVIVQEIGAAHDTPDDLVFDNFHEAAFPGQAIGRPILGTRKTVRGFSAADLRAYLGGRYRAPGMILAGAGAVSHEELVELAIAHFDGFAAEPAPAPAPAAYRGGEIRVARKLAQAHLVLGFGGVSYTDPRFFTAQILANCLGGGMSSRLFQEVREKRGLCYSVYAFHSTYRDAGLFGIYAATGDKELAELVPVIGGELEKIAGRVEDHELARAKAQIKAGLMMSLESSSSRAEQIARQQMVFGRVLPVAEILEAVEAVETGDISALAHDIFSGSPVTVSAIGPLRHLATYGEIAGKFS
ncbi:MAG TPA: pitrilysin family protein [Hyphomicrobiales bacterium]|nr:insulinase family protein [Rhodobiaceae bacterium]HXK53211.1 pitrilysin family protein [Hyphomicrobiales bacterium]